MFDDIYVMFDNYEYQIRPQEYVQVIDSKGNNFCYFLVGKNGHFSIPTAVLGDSFIRNYYIYHDMENKQIGLYGEYMEYFESDKTGMQRAKQYDLFWVLNFMLSS